jgi:hypothetical protein
MRQACAKAWWLNKLLTHKYLQELQITEELKLDIAKKAEECEECVKEPV